MSRRKEWHSPVTYIDGAGHRLIVGQHAFEINGGETSVFFPSTQSHKSSVLGWIGKE